MSGTRGEFQEGRFWFEIDEGGVFCTLGITSRALDEIGDVDSVDLPADAEMVRKDEVLFSVEGTSGKLELLSPRELVIAEINSQVLREPTLVQDDPLDEGWLVKIEVKDEKSPEKIFKD